MAKSNQNVSKDVGVTSLWAGRVYGTNTGNLYVEFTPQEDKTVKGKLRFLDSMFGLVVYEIIGTTEDGVLKLTGTPISSQPGVEVGQLSIVASLTDQGSLRGTWGTSLDTAGTFELYPQQLRPPDQTEDIAAQIPEQLYVSRAQLGAIRLYLDEFHELIAAVKKDFVAGRLIVTYDGTANEVTCYEEEFFANISKHKTLRRLKLRIQEADTRDINKIVEVDLNSFGVNEVRVQGASESWVVGKAQTITYQLKKSEAFLITSYKRFGFGINQIIALGMLVSIPEIPSLLNRTILVAAALAILVILEFAQSRLIPILIVSLTPRKPNLLERMLPSVGSWLMAASAALVATLVAYWLTK